MAQTVAPSRFGKGIARGSSGSFTGDGGATTVNLGFKPKHIRLVNITGVVIWEKFANMTDAQTVKTVTAGTTTIDTTSAITITERGFVVNAAASVNAQLFNYIAS